MHPPVVQISLDLTDIGEALETARIAVEAGVDWLEAGTPLLLAEGLHSVRALRAAFPKTPIVADLKTMDGGYRVEVSQKYPWPGKLQLRGQNALAEASAAGHDLDDMRLQLIESTQVAFYDYYLVDRAVAVNQVAFTTDTKTAECCSSGKLSN